MRIGLKTLSAMEYPGRIITVGRDKSGENIIVIYAITGRSPSSQARKLELEADTVWTKPINEETLKRGNWELLVYPAIWISHGIAVSNGKQTSDIRKCLAQNERPVDVLKLALKDWDYEPDPPLFTPRISGCILHTGKAGLSIIKRAQDGSSLRFFFEIPMIPGKGKMIATYNGENKEPLISFSGEPLDLELKEKNVKSMAEAVYEALKPNGREKKDYRVAVACVFSKNLALNKYDIHIINRQERMKTEHGKIG